MSSHKKQKSKTSKSATATIDNKVRNDSAEKKEEEVGQDGGAERSEGDGGVGGGGLKAFVKAMEGSSHRVVEMRLGVVGACAVAFRVLMYDDLNGKEQVVWGPLALVGGEEKITNVTWEGGVVDGVG